MKKVIEVKFSWGCDHTLYVKEVDLLNNAVCYTGDLNEAYKSSDTKVLETLAEAIKDDTGRIAYEVVEVKA